MNMRNTWIMFTMNLMTEPNISEIVSIGRELFQLGGRFKLEKKFVFGLPV